MHVAKGSFEVKMGPAEPSALAKDAGFGAMSIDKVWRGDLEATSKGEMLHGAEASTGAMAYVALEKVQGFLNGYHGTFLLMHRASMLKSDPKSSVLEISVVPNSGTDQLVGLSGTVKIVIDAKGGHTYEFDYTLSK
ncbi:DUF3224 domain-containing protein [Granulicella cerasi]|uniref:DUF3224 domain-containing protein n=1 Tax=Granulicella cerasi TaxID=741063 RepID=A0ABW1ZAG7_9BACT|nr:DUF3224 domain-containing protein [Granulicella cerasi]